MFYNCSSLTKLNLSSFNTFNVKDMKRMFEKCSSLTSLDLSSFNTQNVISMAFMFNDCSSLKTINLSSFEATNANTECMFSGCEILLSFCSFDKNIVDAFNKK